MNAPHVLNKDNHSRKWLVVYTKSKCEKRAHELLNLQGVQSFCPLVKRRQKWADRFKLVEFPLFNSYLFVRVNPAEQLKVLQTSGIVNFIYYCGKPAVVPDSDIEKIKNYIEEYSDVELVSINTLRPGDPVVIKDGILFDLSGEVIEIRGKSVLVMMKQLDCALVAKVKINSDQIIPASRISNHNTYKNLLMN